MTVTETLKVSSGGDLLSVLPYLVGFHLQESVVIVLLRGSRLVMTARLDSAAFDDPGQVSQRYQQILDQHPDCRVLLAAVCDDLDQGHDHLALLETMTPPDLLVESIVSDQQRWWSRLCHDDCCPAEGQPVERSSAAVAAAVAMGMSPLAGRDELARWAAGPDDETVARLAETHSTALRRCARRSARNRRTRLRELLGRELDGRGLGEAEVVELVHLVTDVATRDVAWMMIRPATAERHQRLWSRVVQVAPDRHALHPLCLLAAAGWIGGNGALMNCALDRGLALRERLGLPCRLLDLLSTVSDNGVNPRVFTDGLDDDAEARGGVNG